jgi:hypothetical protein
LNRDRKEKKIGIKRIKTKYIFVPLDICEKWRSETVVIKQMLSEGFTLEDIREFAKSKLSEKKNMKEQS